MPKPKRGPAIAIVLLVALAVALLVVFVVVPRVVASKIEAAAARRALTIQYGSASYRFTHAEVGDATITPVGSKRITLRAKAIDAKIYGLSPSWIIIPQLDATVSGSLDDVLQAIEPVRKADAALPPSERLPIDVSGGTFTWSSPFGSGSSFTFREMRATVRPAESLLTASLAKGKIVLPSVALDGLSIDLRRSTASGEKVDLKASLASPEEDGHASLEAHKKGGAVEIDAAIEKFALSQASPEIPGLDFSKAVVDATVHAERDDEGAVRSDGKVQIVKLRLPPVKAGPVALAIGGTVKVTWKGTPKKGAPGTMVIDDGKVEVVLGGRARSVKIGGEIAFGETGEGPYVVKLDWEAGPFPCAEVAGDVGGALVKGLAANVVSGSVRARGTIKGDLDDLGALKKTVEILEGCKLDAGKAIGGLLDGLPF